ncbi:MAG: SDR family oxidoreductase [Phycisphaerae bacterium]
MDQLLLNKTAIITGASAGIGWATAYELAQHGARVVLTARRADRLTELAEKIKTDGGQALPVVGDAGDKAHLDQLLAKAIQWTGRLDIVVVNAGRGLAGGVLTSDETQWEALYKLNVLGAAHLMRAAAKIMVETKSGDIVALGSVAGHNISPYSGFYGSTKWAIAAIAESLRREVCGQGVRVTTIKPGVVESEFQAVAGYTYENFTKSIVRFGKVLAPGDVARAIGFVVSQPPHVHINDLVLRPTGQDYP